MGGCAYRLSQADDNHYFNTVEFIDISDESQFIDLKNKLGKIIKTFNSMNCSGKPFQNSSNRRYHEEKEITC